MNTKLLSAVLLTTLAVSTPAWADRPNRGHHGDRVEHVSVTVWSEHRPRPVYRVSHMPPARRYERRPHRPSVRHVWVGGHWYWRDDCRDWVWIAGYWDLPPRAHVVYVEPRYEYVGREVVYVDGGWCEESYSRNDHTATGAVLGGVVGGVIGHQSHKTGVGVLIGAVLGGLIGNEADRAEERDAREAARDRAARLEAEKARAAADAQLEKEKLIAQGTTISDAELAAAQERARLAKEKLAAAKAAKDAKARQEQADRDAALGRAAALEKANAEAAAAEAELRAIEEKAN